MQRKSWYQLLVIASLFAVVLTACTTAEEAEPLTATPEAPIAPLRG